MKSLFSGALLGLMTGGAAVGVVSLVSPQPAGNTPPVTPQVEAPASVVEAPETAEAPEPIAETLDDATTETEAPSGLAPVAQSVLPEADTTPLGLPETTDSEPALSTPEAVETAAVESAAEEPVLPNPQSIAPQIPATEDDLEISTESAPLPVPDAPLVVADPEPEITTPVIVDESVTSAEVDEPSAEDVVADVVTPDADEPASDVAPTPVVEEIAPTLVTPDTGDTSVEDVVAAVDVDEPAPETATAPTLAVPETTEVAPEISDQSAQADTVAPEIVTPPATAPAPVVVTIVEDNDTASPLPSGSGGVVVNRSLGRSNIAEEPEVAETPVVVDPDAPAIERFAAPFENPEDKPTMSLVVLDDGTLQGSVAALTQVPFPVTVALDPTAAGAADAMTAYRAAGIEVALLAKLPVGAQPSDVEIALGAAFATLPETVVMVDAGDGNLQTDRNVMAQAMAALAEDGRGLITVSQGLNAGLQIAEDSGVPAGLIFRDLDGAGQDARVIQRFLDQAAFRARQESGVVLLARLQADTLTALIQWGNANRAGQVAMAPISAVLGDNDS